MQLGVSGATTPTVVLVDAGVGEFYGAGRVAGRDGHQGQIVVDENDGHVRRLDSVQQIASREKAVFSKASQVWRVEHAGEPNAAFAALELARVYAFVGRADRARAVIRRWQEGERDSVERRNAEPWLQLAVAEIALSEHRPDSAIAAFGRADSLPDGPSSGCSACLFINLARAYDSAGNADSTIAALARALGIMRTGKPGIFSLYVGPFEKRLGELWAQRGDRKRAYEHYARFVSLWKEAEPELQPMIARARDAMARLKD